MTVPRLHRWRCLDPTCWAHAWQPIRAAVDPTTAGLDAAGRHYQREHYQREAA